MLFGTKECSACKAKSEHIKDLHSLLEKREQAWENERAEYKRTVDRLLAQRSISPVGEGVRTPPASQPFDMSKIASLWDEVEEAKEKV